jgi:hypothetical protein
VKTGGRVINNMGSIGELEPGSSLTANIGVVNVNRGGIIANQGTIGNNTLEGTVLSNAGTING